MKITNFCNHFTRFVYNVTSLNGAANLENVCNPALLLTTWTLSSNNLGMSPKQQPTSFHRSYAVLPAELSDQKLVGHLCVSQCNKAVFTPRIQEGLRLLKAVQSGQRPFGQAVHIPSFQPRYPKYRLPATLPNLLFMHSLFQRDVCCTAEGKVSVYPVTVYRRVEDQSAGLHGFPCVVVHSGHFKQVLWRLFSASRSYVRRDTLRQHLQSVACTFDVVDDTVLNQVSGLEPYHNMKASLEAGFILLPAHWLYVMKYFFVTQASPSVYQSVPFDHICRNTYRQTFPAYAAKFVSKYRVMYMGDERPIHIMEMLKCTEQRSVHSMARCRAFSEQTQLGTNGMKWVLRPRKTPVQYNDLSLGYGVACWDRVLTGYTSMYAFLCNIPVPDTSMHLEGLLTVKPDLPVQTRDVCKANGILQHLDKNSPTCYNVSLSTRRRRHQLRKKSPELFARFWGKQNVVSAQKRARKIHV